MNLIALSIKRPVFAWILMSSLIIFGSIFFNRLGISQMPDVDFPVINISISYEGAAPEVVEAELIDPMESALLGIEGILEMRSSVSQGQGSITLNFDIKRNVDVALQEVQTALSSIRLPIGVNPPLVKKTNPEESPILFIGIASDRPLRELLKWTDEFLVDQFRFIPGIGQVSVGGFSLRNLRIWPDPQKLKAADLTVLDILEALSSQQLETSAGLFADDKKESRVRWMGEASTPEAVGDIQILRRGGSIIQDRVYKIADVAKVEDGMSDVRRIARFDGHQAVSLMIMKQRGGNEVTLAAAVRKKVEELKKNLPEGIDMRINVDFTTSTAAVIHTTQEKLLVAALVTILVCFLFLGSFSSAINILFSIPTSIIGTLIIVYFSGFTLNLFTLLALTLAISIVVDDAIMLLENIVRHYRMGKSPAQAAYDGSIEILPAAVAATLAVIAVFMPVVFMSGITGKFFFQFGITMSAAVLLSLLEAVTITPMRSAAFLSTSPKISKFELYLEHVFTKWSDAYRSILRLALRYSKSVIFISMLGFALSLFLVSKVNKEFVPQQDQNFIMLNAQLKPGASLEATSKKASEIEKIIATVPEVTGFFTSVGGGPGATSVNQIVFPISLVAREERTKTHMQIMDDLREKLKEVQGVRVSMRDISARGLTSGRMNPLSFNLKGPDLNILNEKAKLIMEQLEKEKLATDLDSDFKLGFPQLLIKPNRKEMARRGVSIDAVARTLNATVAGVRQNQFTSGGRRYDIRVKIPEALITTPEDIKQIEVRNNFGLRVPLSELVEFEDKPTYQSITRINRQRAVGVFGSLGEVQDQSKVLSRAEEISRKLLPEGYDFSLDGTAAGLNESFKSLFTALIIGLLVAYMILAVQFNSFVHPFSVLAALPFSISGALGILWLTGVSLNLFSFIGVIVLMGIAKKNSILLVEFTNQVRESGEVNSLDEALLKACPIRLRPVLMTSVATIAAALPLIIGNGIGQETRTPMGLVIAGGSFVSTLLTLLVVPCIYKSLSFFERTKKIELVFKN